MLVLAFDVGKTGCRAAALFDGPDRIRGAEHDGSIGIADPSGAADAAAMIARREGASRRGPEGNPPCAVVDEQRHTRFRTPRVEMGRAAVELLGEILDAWPEQQARTAILKCTFVAAESAGQPPRPTPR